MYFAIDVFFLLFFFGILASDCILIPRFKWKLDTIRSQSGCQTWQQATTDVFKMIT